MEGGNLSKKSNMKHKATFSEVPLQLASQTRATNTPSSSNKKDKGKKNSSLPKATSPGRLALPPSSVAAQNRDQFLPVANITRIMRRALPSNAKITDEAKEAMQQSLTEFISFVTSEANDRCLSEQRKTVSADDLLTAMSTLGFEDYVEPLTRYLQRYRESEGVEKHSRGAGMPLMWPTMVGPNPTPAYHHQIEGGVDYGNTNFAAATAMTTNPGTIANDSIDHAWFD